MLLVYPQHIAKKVGISVATYNRTKGITEKGSDQPKKEWNSRNTSTGFK
ncbi:MAG: hypothetical protein WBF33_02860 [Candidatus Nitrosopolaris sp.]